MAQTFLFLFSNIMKHKTEDYKLSAVKYYLSNNFSLDYVCNIFECKKSSLKRYNENKEINRTNISYKITKEQLIYAMKLLKNNEQITMIELKKLIMLKYPDFNITSQHLGKHTNHIPEYCLKYLL